VSDGRLTDAELEAIRGRAQNGWPILRPVYDDVESLLRHADTLAADRAAAEGEVEGLRQLVSDLASSEGDGREAQARCYREGAEEGRRQAARLLRQRAALRRDFLRHARTEEERGRAAYAIDVLDDAARALESPPAPAAAPGGES
jgi:hypothetical protein